MPLGYAAKMYVSQGAVDRNGEIATQDGWYYKWYRGLHLLCGEEGINKYQHRPSHEDPLPETWHYDVNFRCVYQEDELEAEETEEVEGRIGSRPVSAVIPIAQKTNGPSGTSNPKRKLVLSPPQKHSLKKSKSLVDSDDDIEGGHDEVETESAAETIQD